MSFCTSSKFLSFERLRTRRPGSPPSSGPTRSSPSLAGDQAARAGGRAGLHLGRRLQVVVVEGEGLVVVVDLRQVGVGEDLSSAASTCRPGAAGSNRRLADPAAVPLVLVLPLLRVADAGFGLDVVEPGVLHAGRLVQTFLQVTEQVWQPMHLSRFSTMPICARTFMRWCGPRGLNVGGPSLAAAEVQPVDLVHLAHHDELVAVGADGSVVVEAVAEAARSRRSCASASARRVTELWMPPRMPVISGARRVHDLLLRVVHQTMPGLTRWLTTARARCAVDVEQLDPVVVDDAAFARRPRSQPDHGPPRLSVSISRLSVGAVDAPLLVRRDEVQRISGLPLGFCRGSGAVVFRSTGGR